MFSHLIIADTLILACLLLLSVKVLHGSAAPTEDGKGGKKDVWKRGSSLSLPIKAVNDVASFIDRRGTTSQDLWQDGSPGKASLTHRWKRSNQFPLQGSTPSSEVQDASSIPLYARGLYLMIFPLSVGTPRQRFLTILSLHESDLFVLSSACHDPTYAKRNHYDHSQSSTYVANSTTVSAPFWNARGNGSISQDTIHIGEVDVTDCNFAEVTTVETGLSVSDVYFEGILGLGPKHGNSSTGQGNLVTTMYNQGLIPRNLFSITLPYDDDFDTGRLTFGDTSEETDLDDVTFIPVTNVPGFDPGWAPDFLSNTWQVSASSVYLGDGSIINKTLGGYSAWIETEVPWIGLPEDTVDELHDYMGATRQGWSPIFTVRCDERPGWPDLTFVLGGEEFRMSPFDYTIEGKNPDGFDKLCYSLFISGDYRGGIAPSISLGTGWLRGFETVFDLERDMVGFKELLHRE